MKTIGITGGIGSGKSLLLELFDKIDTVTICSADQIGRQLQEKGGAAYGPIVETFGMDYLLPDGELDRKALSELVFADEKRLNQLNAIVHPLVHEEVQKRIHAAAEWHDDLFFLESAILLDVGYEVFCDEVWWMRTSYDTRLDRLKAQRGLTEEDMNLITGRQKSDEDFAAACDQIIDNNGSPNDLREEINRQLTRLGLDAIRV